VDVGGFEADGDHQRDEHVTFDEPVAVWVAERGECLGGN
jgi:hypothetical protein